MNKLIKYLKMLYVPMSVIFIGVVFTGTYFSSSVSSTGNIIATGVSRHSDIIINEIYSNPPGSIEDLPLPGGEWVELYNNGNWGIDIAGWHIYDAIDSHDLPITSLNSGGSTLIPAKGYLVVYRNGDADFSLNNSGDTVRLYDGAIWSSSLIHNRSYPSAIEGRTWSGMPDGNGAWSDGHNPSPGGPNV